MERPSVAIASGRLRGALLHGDPGGTGAPPAAGAGDLNRGGTPEADAALGRAAWPAVLDALRLRSRPASV